MNDGALHQDGYVHHGMLLAAQAVLSSTLHVLMDAAAANPTYGVVCTGHSLGASTAIIVCILLRQAQVGVLCAKRGRLLARVCACVVIVHVIGTASC